MATDLKQVQLGKPEDCSMKMIGVSHDGSVHLFDSPCIVCMVKEFYNDTIYDPKWVRSIFRSVSFVVALLITGMFRMVYPVFKRMFIARRWWKEQQRNPLEQFMVMALVVISAKAYEKFQRRTRQGN